MGSALTSRRVRLGRGQDVRDLGDVVHHLERLVELGDAEHALHRLRDP